MSDTQLQFRVGLFVIAAAVAGTGLAVRFGELDNLWKKSYTLAVHFDEAPGLIKGTPVRKSGILIGHVKDVFFEDQRGGVMSTIELDEKYSIRADASVRLVQSILGDSTIEISAGRSAEMLKPGTTLEGAPPVDPMKIISRVETQVSNTLSSLTRTTSEWEKVGRNVNALVETNRGNLDKVVERAAESLHQFTLTMHNANRYLNDPDNERNLRETLASLPKLTQETQETILAVRAAVLKMDDNLTNLNKVTTPLGHKAEKIITKLDSTTTQIELLAFELNTFARSMNSEEGSIRMMAEDPQLYRNLNQSAASLNVLLKNLEPIIRDMRIFSDKVARHPELIGVGGAIRGSSGIKQ